MSRPVFLIGLIVSAAVHAFWVWAPSPVESELEPRPAAAPTPAMVEVARLAEEPAPAPPMKAAPGEVPPSKPSAPAPAAPAPVPLVETHKPAPAASDGGDLAGRRAGAAQPVVRIDWGSPAKAREVLAAGGMKLVILRADLSFARELVHQADGYRVRPFEAAVAVRYSNSLRVVDRVAAFRDAVAAADLAPGQRLAVLIPADVENAVGAALASAIAQRGLVAGQVSTLGGRFVTGATGVRFEVTRIQRRGDRS